MTGIGNIGLGILQERGSERSKFNESISFFLFSGLLYFSLLLLLALLLLLLLLKLVHKLLYKICSVPGFEPESLLSQTIVLPMSYTHHAPQL